MADEYDYMFKIVVIGDSGVGKTNLLTQYIHEKFSSDSKPTIGVEFATKFIQFEDKKIKAQFWDTAGQERFRAIVSAYYRGVHGAIIAFDLTRSNSLDNVDKWFKELQQYGEIDIPIMLVGNKMDLTELRLVAPDTACQVAMKHRTTYMETSASNGDNVRQSFEMIIKQIYEKKKLDLQNMKTLYNTSDGIDLSVKSIVVNKKSCC